MAASFNLLSAAYRLPLSRYFCFCLLGSREQPTVSPKAIETASTAETRNHRGANCIFIELSSSDKNLYYVDVYSVTDPSGAMQYFRNGCRASVGNKLRQKWC